MNMYQKIPYLTEKKVINIPSIPVVILTHNPFIMKIIAKNLPITIEAIMPYN